MNNKSKLKIMATSLALSAVSSGAWGAISCDLQPSGIMIWAASMMKVGAAFGAGNIPTDGAIITTREHVFSKNNEPIAVLKLVQATNLNWTPTTTGLGDRTRTDAINLRKELGIFNRNRLPLPTDTNEGTEIRVCCVVQPLPYSDIAKPEALYLRPEFLLNPSTIADERNVTLDCLSIHNLKIDGQHPPTATAIDKKTVNVRLKNKAFCDPADGNLMVVTADQLANVSYVSFISRIRVGRFVYYTCHILVNQREANIIRTHMRLAYIVRNYENYFGPFRAIYGTDASATATFAANLSAIYKEAKSLPSDSNPSMEDLEKFWKDISNSVGVITLSGRINVMSGPRGFIDYIWLMNSDWNSIDGRKGGNNALMPHINNAIVTLFP
jgi:hypothetical protein